MPPEVSVIIPAYNREATIGRAIGSVLAQSMQDFEIIVIDDGSKDSTPAVAEGFCDDRIRIGRHDRNRGAAAARNTGIGAARGAFLAFLDSDDEWFPDKLVVQLEALRGGMDEMGVSCTGVVLHLLDRGIRLEYPLPDCADWRRRLALGCDERPGSTLLAKREVFDRVGLFDETLPRFEDWDWMLRYAASGGRVLVVSPPLAHIYNIRGRLGAQTEESALCFLAKHEQLYASLPSGDRRQALCDLWLQIASTYAVEGQLSASTRLALRGLSNRPIYATKRLITHAIELASIKRKDLSRLSEGSPRCVC